MLLRMTMTTNELGTILSVLAHPDGETYLAEEALEVAELALALALALPGHSGRKLPAGDALVAARRDVHELVAGVAPPAQTDAVLAVGASFERVGEFWEVHFAGRSAHLNATKGMTDLSRLLAEPGTEIHCMDLVGATVEQSSTGEVVDETARRQFEQRIRELQAEIDEAEHDHDYGRADRARFEQDALVDHLTAALGLAGRARQGGGTAERARSAVTQRLRATIRRITDAHRPLGRHFDASIKTGTFCSYQPENPVHWTTSTRT